MNWRVVVLSGDNAIVLNPHASKELAESEAQQLRDNASVFNGGSEFATSVLPVDLIAGYIEAFKRHIKN